MTEQKQVYWVAVTLAYGTKVHATNEEEAESIALSLDFTKEMSLYGDVSVDVQEMTHSEEGQHNENP
tara:strand:+ start:978 stop:1178 length:201 start_codon:yes stop_codon:yes gene_type:complete